ncbi:hypothetical protein A3D06_01305 [Candidatus Roizmanbacteria bacterium RIFCSPHIGHO2_02_FULL_40_9]|uniref:Small ribosomal subunit protein bS20 n=2 Tax=Candidatus Roizmaniibacteriota TaxID=1752723 RepID=A0A1F7IJZ3_9BACT|nr:MAG: hypothetical protein A3D06_01305 [Candidatus Roizmanbacteria bacterium RIFCSPHIGHO2_02_FULL_40_9]OGK43680.1 MAG: hypothetical protein A2957_02935 [Candidatus Roizmanbacteria bacterium RIFCSPLOWO2_01_FULL_38_11]
MPIIKSAQKKLKQDKFRKEKNDELRHLMRDAVHDIQKKAVKKAKVAHDDLNKAFSRIDKAAKNKIVSKSKAARLKSRVSKLALGGK